MNFDKKQTQSLKGVAILIMFFHHAFIGVLQMTDYNMSFFPISLNAVNQLAAFGKICIYLFAFVSGYGLWKDYSKNRNDIQAGKWVLVRYIKTFQAYWFIFVLEFIYHMVHTNFIQDTFFANYSKAEGGFYVILNFFGLHNIFNTPSMDMAWWYMSAAIIIIALIPLIHSLAEKVGSGYLLFLYILIQTLIMGTIGYNYVTSMISQISTAFIGMYAADLYTKKQTDLLSVGNAKIWSRVCMFLLALCSVVVCYKVYPGFNDKTIFMVIQRGLFPLPVIYFTLRYLSKVFILRDVLAFLGKYSNYMYLTHLLFYGHVYFGSFNYKTWMYSGRNFLVSYLIYVITILLLSIVIDFLKKVLFYDKGMNKLISLVTKE